MILVAWAGLCAGCVVGYFAGRFTARCAADETVNEALVDRDIANFECAAAQAEARRLEALLAASMPFSTGAGSPWERPAAVSSQVAE